MSVFILPTSNPKNYIMQQPTILLSIIIGMALISVSCKKLVEVPDPASSVVRSRIFSNEESARAVVVDMYGQMQNGISFTNGHGSKLAGLYIDELQPTGAANPIDLPFYHHELTAASPVCKSLWANAYTVIYVANALLEGLEVSTTIADTLRQQLMGEARFVRALHYFYLTHLFGEVPLVLTTDYYVNRYLSRAAVQAVYQQIVADLQVAILTLPVNRVAAEADRPGNIRPTRWAAMALLARVRLYQGDWQGAWEMANFVLESGRFSLAAVEAVFLKQSPEILFQLQPVMPGGYSADAGVFLPPVQGGMSPYVFTAVFLNRFAAGDARRTAWLDRYQQGATTYYSPYKYRQRSGAPVTEYTVVLRLAEVYLIRAEAGARLGRLQGPAGALADLNVIRARAQLTPLPAALQQQAVLDSIGQERAVELGAEWMHRWGDLTRWPGRQDPAVSRFREEMQVYRPGLPQYRELWPVPADQLLLNAAWKQNPGY